MAVGPITYTEIDAYRRLTFADLNVWEIGLIRRIDAAVLAVVAGDTKPRTTKTNAPPEPIPVSNTEGIRALFQGLAAKKNAKKGGQHG